MKKFYLKVVLERLHWTDDELSSLKLVSIEEIIKDKKIRLSGSK